MASLIPNGVYKIRNSEFLNRVVDLLGGNPNGEIAGQHDSKDLTNKWLVRDAGAGPDRVTLESFVAPGTFAHAHQAGGHRIVPSSERTVWSIVKADGERYSIQSQNGQLVWELPESGNGVPIVLRPHTGQAKTKWRFERLNM